MSLKIKWLTQTRKVSELIACENNPRTWTEEELEDLKKSLQECGYAETIAINTNNILCAGHMRVRALLDLGLGDTEIEVRVPERELNEEEFNTYLIRSNKNRGRWDFDKINAFGDEFLKKVGFKEWELDRTDDILNDLKESSLRDHITQESDEFAVTFILSMRYKEAFESKGKKYFQDMILKEIEELEKEQILTIKEEK